ncbi:hypothetical protein ACH4TC_41085 [Streptomyces spororaveus]|uniref:hypothetical protein n=1 Tax=Streptomyces spororaveus TaxID=284039 RepID=UPI0037904346
MDFETREDRQPQGRKELTAERAAYFRLMQQGVSDTQACRIVGINRRNGRGASGSDEAAPPTTAVEPPSVPSWYLPVQTGPGRRPAGPLSPDAARRVAEHLTAAAPGHPWTGAKFSATWGSRDTLDTTLVHPTMVADVSADRAIDHGGVNRHPLRFQRLRLDVTPQDVPRFGAGPPAAASGPPGKPSLTI